MNIETIQRTADVIKNQAASRQHKLDDEIPKPHAVLNNVVDLKSHQIEDFILTDLRKRQHPVAIYLQSGICLRGFISAIDESVIVLKGIDSWQLVYKHTIATISINEVKKG